MRILFVVPYPTGVAPSQRFRFEQYFNLLTQHHIDFEIQSFWNIAAWNILYSEDKIWAKTILFIKGLKRRIQLLFSLTDFDFVFIHREAMPIGPPFFEWFIAKICKKKIIYDFDDAIWLLNTSSENKAIGFLKWHQKTKSICRWSYKVSCGNDYLIKFAQQYNQRTVLNPTTIDTVSLHVSTQKKVAKKNIFTVGWTGTHSTLKYLDQIIPILEIISNKYPHLEFNIIADKPPSFNYAFVRFTTWTKENEIDDLNQFDIGVMPLFDDPWSKGKCGFKALQYMALGIPTLASPVGVNSKIIDHGINGFLCSTENEWINCLEKLIANDDLRMAIGQQGRKKITDHYSALSNSSNFLSLFS